MKNLIFAVSGLAILSSCAGSQNKDNEKMNVLFIAVDDLKPALGCYGDTIAVTPNFDRLARMSTVFESNYCQQALSGPTRSSLMTGLRPDHTHVYDLQEKLREMNPNVETIPQHFKNEGFVTSGVGKVFQGSNVIEEDNEFSWSVPYLTADAYYDKKYGKPAIGFFQEKGLKENIAKYEAEYGKTGLTGDIKDFRAFLKDKNSYPLCEAVDVPDNAYGDGAVALCAIDQLKKLKGEGRPFFMAVGFQKPHLPLIAPKKYWDLYDRERLPLARFREHAEGSPDFAYYPSCDIKKHSGIQEYCREPDIRVRHTGLSEAKQKEIIHGYYACTSYVDALLGKLLDTLEELDLMDNTVIVLWGDHGWHLGDHDIFGKHTNFEQATRAPMMIAVPGMKPHHTRSLSEFVDIYPTLCDLCGISTPEILDGVSLVPLLKDGEAEVKAYAQSLYPRWISREEARKAGFEESRLMGYTIRTARYRYTMWMGDFRSYDRYSEEKVFTEELYDYQEDPLETRNHVNDEAYAGARKEMKALMLDFFDKEHEKGKENYQRKAPDRI